ncbi:GtrA family protein [Blastomonas sp. AAP53]|uniref:GtrA family protein n=1 Tax=Blastomonas sp. AAP53 TaxID=1248760 RepID=UPI00030E3438|nr:GtrA family protein [Blastomonas sp. AAP53]
MRKTEPGGGPTAMPPFVASDRPKHGLRLVLHYAAFAILATIANLGTQSLLLSVNDGAIFYYAALVCGTGAGLVLKYALDKYWIFADPGRDIVTNAQQFSLYSLMGVATTLIFWTVETTFWIVWDTHQARVAGALLGLGIGYCVKYHLDRRFVFAGRSGLAVRYAAPAAPPA